MRKLGHPMPPADEFCWRDDDGALQVDLNPCFCYLLRKNGQPRTGAAWFSPWYVLRSQLPWRLEDGRYCFVDLARWRGSPNPHLFAPYPAPFDLPTTVLALRLATPAHQTILDACPPAPATPDDLHKAAEMLGDLINGDVFPDVVSAPMPQWVYAKRWHWALN